MFILTAVRLVLIKPTSTSMWTGVSNNCVVKLFDTHFFIWVGPSMDYDFKDAIHIDHPIYPIQHYKHQMRLLRMWMVSWVMHLLVFCHIYQI